MSQETKPREWTLTESQGYVAVWEGPEIRGQISVIEKSAYDALEAKLAELQAQKEIAELNVRLKNICDDRDQAFKELIEERKLADQLRASLKSAYEALEMAHDLQYKESIITNSEEDGSGEKTHWVNSTDLRTICSNEMTKLLLSHPELNEKGDDV